MTIRTGFIIAVLLLAGAINPSFAQQPGAPLPDPDPTARIQLGPLAIKPAVIFREVGYDSNVLNEKNGEQGDFTATLGARVDLGTRLSKFVGSYSSFYEYLYFQDFIGERGSNRGAEGRVDLMFARLRPHVLGGIRKSHERPSAEIDARALRELTHVGAGLAAVVMSRTTLNADYRRNTVGFADGESFRGVDLREELNSHSDSLTYGADFQLSPLTTLSVHGEELQERFTLSPHRDADSHRYGVTATLNPLALISGRATVGVAAFRPASPLVKDFTGITAAVALGYSFHDESRLGLTIDRDVRHSFAEETPYYVATGVRGTFTQRIVRNIDAQLTGGFDRIAYEARLDTAGTVGDQLDRVKTGGAGIGLRLGDGGRLSFNFDYTTRTSPVALREYSRGRLFATLTYGF